MGRRNSTGDLCSFVFVLVIFTPHFFLQAWKGGQGESQAQLLQMGKERAGEEEEEEEENSWPCH